MGAYGDTKAAQLIEQREIKTGRRAEEKNIVIKFLAIRSKMMRGRENERGGNGNKQQTPTREHGDDQSRSAIELRKSKRLQHPTKPGVGAVTEQLGLRAPQPHDPGFINHDQRNEKQQARPGMPGRAQVAAGAAHD